MQPAGVNDNVFKESIRTADAAIQAYYRSGNNLKIVRLSGEELELDKCYINLALVNQVGTKQKKETFSLRERLRLEADNVGEPITLEALFEPRKSSNDSTILPRRIFIQGRAGIGKSTLCKKIADEFLRGRLGQKLFDRLLWIPLRRLKIKGKDYGWQELIQDAYPLQDPTWKKNREAYSDRLYDSTFLGRTLLLFDGLDEVSRGWVDGDNMREFLGSVICDSPNVIITSRPHTKALSIGQFDLELGTVGFRPHQVDTYLENCAIPEAIPKMKSFIVARPLIQGLLRIPIQLDAFCCTWKHGEDLEQNDVHVPASHVRTSRGDDISTMTQLYWSISLELCRKDMAHLARLDRDRKVKDSRFSQLSEEELKTFGDFEVQLLLERELTFLGELAFQGMASDIIDFSPQHQNRIVSHLSRKRSEKRLQLPTPYNSILEALSFLRSSDIDQHPSKRNYHFLHLTFQEFFAARHFVEHWQDGAPLYCLSLPSSSKPQELLPLEFLCKEKYNPRYNIFWRFVAGLIQIQSDKPTKLDKHDNQQDVIGFFNQLHEEPIDLLRATHCRLLMYCLSEVVPSERQEIQELRKREGKILYQETIRRSESFRRNILREVEFPDSVLCSFLEHVGHLPDEVVLGFLRCLEARPFIGTQALRAVSPFMVGRFPIELRLQAVRVIFKNSRVDSRETIAWAAQIYGMISKDMDPMIRGAAAKALRYARSPPQEAITVLIEMLEDEDSSVRTSAIKTSGLIPSLHQKAIAALIITITEDKHLSVRLFALDMLSRWPYQPQEAIDLTTTMLKDENPEVRANAANVLGEQPSSLLQETITALTITMTKDENQRVRSSAAYALAKQSSLSQKVENILISMLTGEGSQMRFSVGIALFKQSSVSQGFITALITIMLKDEDSKMQCLATEILGKQPFLPQEIVIALTTMLKDENEDSKTRILAAYALGEYSSLPQEVINTLITMFKDRDIHVRALAAEVVDKQSFLPREIITVLATMLMDKNKDLETRILARKALNTRSSLSQDNITALTATLNDRDPHVRYSIVEILGGQPYLPPETIVAVTATLKDEFEHVRASAAQILGKELFLPQESITALITIPKDKEHYAQRSIVEALGKQLSRPWSFLHQKIIAAIIATLKHQGYPVYDILDRYGLFYTNIKDLPDETWQQLWSFWLEKGCDRDISCYEFEGSLNVWIGGVLHPISIDPARTQEILQVVLGGKTQQPAVRAVVSPGKTKQGPDVVQENAVAASASKSRRHSGSERPTKKRNR